MYSTPDPLELEDARSSFAYWERRHKTLPLYRRRARREAREMMARWEDRLRAAELARFEASLLGRLLTALGISSLWVRRMKSRKPGLLSVAWSLVPREAKLVVGGLAAAWLIVAVLVTAAVVALLQLA